MTKLTIVNISPKYDKTKMKTNLMKKIYFKQTVINIYKRKIMKKKNLKI